eukprot:984848_1
MLRNKVDGKDEEADALTAGDDAFFGNNIITIIKVNWSSNIPFATVRMHVSNRIHYVPWMDLAHIANGKGARNSNKIEGKVMNNSANHYTRRSQLVVEEGNEITSLSVVDRYVLSIHHTMSYNICECNTQECM